MITIDCNFPGGNILVDEIRGDEIFVHQDLRDTTTDWFYWYFRVNGAAGRHIRVTFTKSNVIGVRGPGLSLDGGKTWQWLGAEAVEGLTFSYAVPATAEDVRFSFGMPYLQKNLDTFLQRHAGNPHLAVGELCRSNKGRAVEFLHLGQTGWRPPLHRILLTCRHHCCEMMASYSLEGILETILSDTEIGFWFRDHVEALVVPFIDKDGVEDGDQGKNRAPRDHNRDYDGVSVHPTNRAMRQQAPGWADGHLHLALDMHCPHIRGQNNEDIYFPGGPEPENWKEVLRFSSLIEKVQTGPLVFSAANNLPLWPGLEHSFQHQPGDGLYPLGGCPAGDKGRRIDRDSICQRQWSPRHPGNRPHLWLGFGQGNPSLFVIK